MKEFHEKKECCDDEKECYHYIDDNKKYKYADMCMLIARNDPPTPCEFKGDGYKKCESYESNWLLGKQYKEEMARQKRVKFGLPEPKKKKAKKV